MSGIKIGLTQVKRSLFEIDYHDEKWISARWCSVNPPIQDRIMASADFGTQDFNVKTEVSHEEYFDPSTLPDSLDAPPIPDDPSSGAFGLLGSLGETIEKTGEVATGAVEDVGQVLLGGPPKPKADFTKRQPYK